MCNVHCATRYCGCDLRTAAITVIIFRILMLALLLVFPFIMICAVLDEFYEISGHLIVQVQDYNNVIIFDDVDIASTTPSGATNLTVLVSAGWQHMSFELEDHKKFEEEYYAVSVSETCKQVSCKKLNTAHDNGVRFLFACISGLAWSFLTLCIISFHGATRKLKKSTVTKVFTGCLCLGFIPEILIIIFQIMFSDNNSFCGMHHIFDELIEEHFTTESSTFNIQHSHYDNCQYKSSNIETFPITWIPGCLMVLLLIFLCVYKPLSPFFRRIFNTCSCCVDRKVSDSVIPVARFFSFSGDPGNRNSTRSPLFPPPKRKFSGSLN